MTSGRLTKLDRSGGLALAESLRSEVENVLSKAQPLKQNITRHERKHIKVLEDLFVLPPDKGKVAVIMDVDSYGDKSG